MANFLNYIIESTIQPVKTNVLWIKNGVPYYFNKRWKPLLGGGSGIVDSPIIFGDGVNNAILKDSYNITNGENTVALGYNLTTNNFAEAAFGKYNNSIKSDDPSKATLFSVGNGASDTLKNVFEIKYNGSIYIDGIEKPIQEYLKNLEFNYNNINTEFSEAIIKINGSIKDTNSRITQTSEAIRLEVSQIEKSLDSKISENSTQILQTAEEIQFIAKSVADVDDKVTTQQTLINQTSDKVNILAIKDEELDSKIRQNTSQIEQTSESINLRIIEIDRSLGDLGEQVVENNTAINQTSENIELLAQENRALSEKVTKNEADIKINSDKISLSVTQESFDTLSTKVEENSSEIEINKNAITTKVEQNTFDAYSRESSSKFTEIEQTIDGITTTVQSNSGEITIIKTDIEGLTAKTSTLEADVDTLKKQSDGAIDTHFGTAIPTLDNEPAINWTTDELKREHVGDLYYNNVSGEAFRFSYNPETDTYFWVMLSDSALTEALDKISKLEEAIDGKVSIFYTQPSNYKYGDIWFVHNNAYSPYKESSLLTATNIDKNIIIETFNLDHWVLKADIVKSLEDLDEEVTNAFKDKILTSAEVDAIRENKKSFEASFEELSSGHAIIVASTLEDTTSLNLAFSELENKYTLLIQAINSLILDSDGNLDEELIQNYTNNYNSYLEALKNYSKIKAELTDSIQKSLSSANDYIKDITSDGVLTSIEKKNFLEIWRGFAEEFSSNKGIAVNYKIIDSEGNKRTDIYETDKYYSNYLLYSTAFNDVKSIFESDVFGLSNITESTKLPTGYSVGDIESSFDNYYNALSIFSEMISKITIEITDAHEKVLHISRELQEQLTPSDSITQIGKGVILSSIIGVQSNGVLQAGLNATNIEGLVDDSIDKHGRIILAGGIKGKTNWNEATTVIYEDGHIKINSGEIGEFVEIGNALIKSVVSGKIDLFSYPETINGVTSLIPLFQINKDATGKIISISTVYDLYVNGNLVISGDVASGGEGEETPAEGTVTRIDVDGTPYNPDSLGVIDLSEAFKNVKVDLSDYYTKYEVNELIDQIKAGDIDLANYYTKEEIDGKGFLTSASLVGYAKTDDVDAVVDRVKLLEDAGYATTGYVSQAISDLNIGQFATKTALAATVEALSTEIGKKADADDVADTYATKVALSTVDNRLVSIESYFATSEDAGNQIDKWNEIVAFLNATEGTTLSGILAAYYSKTEIDGKITTINAEIAKRAFQSDLTALVTRVGTAEGYITSLTNGKADRSELSKYVLLEKASQTIKGDITIEGNLIITGDVASGGEGGNTSAEGTVTGVTVSGVDYTSVEAGLLDLTDLMANYALKSASTKVSVSPSLSSGKSIGVISVDGVGTTLYAPATYAWSEISDVMSTSEFNFIPDGFSGNVNINYRTIDKKATGSISNYLFRDGSNGGGYASLRAKSFIVNDGTSSQFLKGDGSVDNNAYVLAKAIGAMDANTIYDASMLSLGGGSNTPFSLGYGSLLTMPYRKMTGNTKPDFAAQIFIPNGDATKPYLYYRTSIGNSWNAWRTVLDDSNYSSYALKKGAETYRLNIETPLTSNDADIYAYFQRISADGTNVSASDIGSARKGVLRLAGGGSESQLLFDHYNSALYYRNYQTSSWSAWKTIAFTDSTVDKAKSVVDANGNALTLLHSGNVGEYALKYIGPTVVAESELPALNTFGLWHTKGAYIRFGLSEAYNITIRTNANKLQALMNASKDADWKTIAFTDSTVEAAKKIVDGNGNTKVSVLYNGYVVANGFYLTADVIERTSTTDALYLQYNSKGNTIINAKGGKVGIGTTSPQYKLDVAGTGRFTDFLLVSGTLTANSGATITGDVTINGNLIVSGDVASGGTGQDTPSDGSTSTSGVLTLTGEIPEGSNIPQSSLDAIGLTDRVIADMLIGKYHHVMYTSGITTYCFVVSGKYNSDYKAFVLYWGDSEVNDFMGYSFASSANGWYIELYEI